MTRFSIKTILILAFLFPGGVMAFTLTSSAFSEGNSIPSKYTCDGNDISPPLNWTGAPQNTKSFVLILDDPDAPGGTWDHWVVYNLSSNSSGLTENLQTLPAPAQTGKNSWGREKYNGPCPPDREHRYYFTLYALDANLQLSKGPTKNQVEAALKNHLLDKATLMGRYNRK